VTAAPGGGGWGGAPYPVTPPPGTPCVAHISHTGSPLTRPRVPRTVTAHAPLAQTGPPRSGAATAGADRDSTRDLHWGIPDSRPGPPETLGQARPRALGRRDGDPFRWGNCDGRTPGPRTRGSSSLPVKRGDVDSRHGRSDPVSSKRPLTLAREKCPTDAYFDSFRWRSTCDRPVTHKPQPRSRDFPGTSKSPRRPPFKGLILCKPDLDH